MYEAEEETAKKGPRNQKKNNKAELGTMKSCLKKRRKLERRKDVKR
jgi:hypothetical protein